MLLYFFLGASATELPMSAPPGRNVLVRALASGLPPQANNVGPSGAFGIWLWSKPRGLRPEKGGLAIERDDVLNTLREQT